MMDTDTHYDGQITWDPYCAPTSQNGVTTVVFGNWYANRQPPCRVTRVPRRTTALPS